MADPSKAFAGADVLRRQHLAPALESDRLCFLEPRFPVLISGTNDAEVGLISKVASIAPEAVSFAARHVQLEVRTAWGIGSSHREQNDPSLLARPRIEAQRIFIIEPPFRGGIECQDR